MFTDTIDPRAEFRTVRVGAVAADHDDFRPQRDFLAEDPDHRTSLHDTAPKGMLGLEPDDEHRVSLIRCALCEMVQNTSAFHWDMICDLRQGGTATADGDVVLRDGEYRI